MTGLSKSRYMHGLQCPKRLYLQVHHGGLLPPLSADQRFRFIQGHRVTEEARRRFTGGVLVDEKLAARDAIERTRGLVEGSVPAIFEGAFRHEGVFIRADILVRSGDGWELIEVKSSTSLKEEYVNDVALQAWVIAGSGLALRRVVVAHVNNQCVFPDLREFLVPCDVTDEVRKRSGAIPAAVARLLKTLEGDRIPDVDIGPHCDTPYECPLQDHCKGERGVVAPSVFEIPGLGMGAWDFYARGIRSLTDPRIEGLRPRQERIVRIVRSGRRHVDPRAIAEGMREWEWPLHYLDFETSGPAIPRFPGTRPYQQIPFQFSCFVQDRPGAEPRHFEYLHGDASDPRPPLAAELARAIGERGSVVAYSKGAEKASLGSLADSCPDLAPRLDDFAARLVDPKPVIERGVYDAAFAGKFGLKSVAPALLGREMSYEGMAVGDGQAAQLAFDELIGAATPAARKREIREALLAYCKQDTFAMVRLVEWLSKEAAR